MIQTASTITIQNKSIQIEYAIRTKNVWLLKSLALSYGGLLNDTYRQQAWPILVSSWQQQQEQQHRSSSSSSTVTSKSSSGHRQDHDDDCKNLTNSLIHTKKENLNDIDNNTTTVSIPSPTSSSSSSSTLPLSPTSVMTNDISISSSSSFSTRDTSAKYCTTMNDDDTTIMWYDLQRWYPPSFTSSSTTSLLSTSLSISMNEYRHLLAHVIEQSLLLSHNKESVVSVSVLLHNSTNSNNNHTLRYYQGYHIVAGTILSTYISTVSSCQHHSTTISSNSNNNINRINDDDLLYNMKDISYGINDTIQLLQQMIDYNISYMNHLVMDDTFTSIIYQIRDCIIPLYHYIQYNNNIYYRSNYNNHCTFGYDTTSDDDEHENNEEYMIAQCLPWIFTLFGTSHNNNIDHHKRMIDAIFASHPTYFILYLCVSKLLLSSLQQQQQPCHADDDETIILNAICIMKYIPPNTLPYITDWFQKRYMMNTYTNNMNNQNDYHDHSNKKNTIISKLKNIIATFTMMINKMILIYNSIQQYFYDLQNLCMNQSYILSLFVPKYWNINTNVSIATIVTKLMLFIVTVLYKILQIIFIYTIQATILVSKVIQYLYLHYHYSNVIITSGYYANNNNNSSVWYNYPIGFKYYMNLQLILLSYHMNHHHHHSMKHQYSYYYYYTDVLYYFYSYCKRRIRQQCKRMMKRLLYQQQQQNVNNHNHKVA